MKTRRRPLRLEICGALHGAQLPHANHRPRHGSAQPHRIGNDQPNVGMRLKNQRRALDRRGVGAFAALGEPRFDQRRGIGEPRDPQAGGALAAEIVREALAICGLREHSRQRVFPDAARPREKQRAGHAFAAEAFRAARSRCARCREIRRSPFVYLSCLAVRPNALSAMRASTAARISA